MHSVIRSLISEEVDWQRILSRFVIVNEGGVDADDGQEDDTKLTGDAAPSAVCTAPTVLQRTFRGSFSRPNLNFRSDV